MMATTQITPILWSEFRVNPTTDGIQAGVQLQALANGKFMSLWQDGPELAATALYMQRFYSGAVPEDTKFDGLKINTTAGAVNNAVFTELEGGRIVVAWEHYNDTNVDAPYSIRARVFEADGTPVDMNGNLEGGTDDFEVTAGGAAFTNPSITALEGGGFVIAYEDEESNADVRGVVYPSGTTTEDASSIEINPAGTSGGNEFMSSVVDLGGRSFLAFYTDEVTGVPGSTLRARFFSAAGSGVQENADTAVGGINTVKYGTAPTVIVLKGVNKGKILVSWTEEVTGGTTDVKAQVFTVNAITGTLIADGDARTVNRITAGNQGFPSVAALKNGGFAISYVDDSTGSNPQVRVAVFNSNKDHVLVEDTVLNSTWAKAIDRTAPSIIELEDGRLIAAWDERPRPDGGRDDTDGGIWARVIDARTTGIELLGTPGIDQYVGTQFDDTLKGAGGDDHLNGAGGNDILDGGIGRDVLNGGAGTDKMTGGSGDDTYYLDAAGDQVIEYAGGGNDTVYVTYGISSYTLAAEVENLVVTNASSVTLIGNASNNSISGSSGADAINGGAGADTMSGGLGSDTYYVDNAGDQVVETSGDAADQVFTTVNYTLGANVENLTAASAASLILTGNELNNAITGDAGNDTIDGGVGLDNLNGGAGGDRIYNGLGNDVLTGGAGKDVFVFNAAIGTTKTNKLLNFDTITDFNVKDDTFWLDNAVFKKLGKKGSEAAPAKLKKDFFVVGSKAKDKNDYLVYDKKKGILSYDADGSGKGKAVEIAKLSKNLKMTAADFFVI